MVTNICTLGYALFWKLTLCRSLAPHGALSWMWCSVIFFLYNCSLLCETVLNKKGIFNASKRANQSCFITFLWRKCPNDCIMCLHCNVISLQFVWKLNCAQLPGFAWRTDDTRCLPAHQVPRRDLRCILNCLLQFSSNKRDCAIINLMNWRYDFSLCAN